MTKTGRSITTVFGDRSARADLGDADAHKRQHAFEAGASTAAPTSTALCVDDWAIKRGNTYGSVLVNLNTRRAVDLMPDRCADTLAAWLHPRRCYIKVVARDRSTAFSRDVVMGAPRAVQVADRWHLLQNTREMLTRWLFGVYGRLHRLPSTAAVSSPRQGVHTRAFPRTRTTQATSAESRARSLARHEEVRRQAARESFCVINKAMGLVRATVRRCARAENSSERAVRAPGPSRLDPFISWLQGRLLAGCENASALYRALRERSYPGSSRQVHGWVHTQRVAPAKTTLPCRLELSSMT